MHIINQCKQGHNTGVYQQILFSWLHLFLQERENPVKQDWQSK